jgi:hypothetical protein
MGETRAEVGAPAQATPGAWSLEPGAAGRQTPEARRPKTEDRPQPETLGRWSAQRARQRRTARAETLMVAHVVLFRPKPQLPDDARQRLVDGFTRAIREIPQIRRARIGRRVTHGRPYEQLMRSDYTFAAVLEFDDLEALKGYLEHGAHDALGAAFFECFDEALVYDYELGDATERLPMLLGS